MIGPNLSDWALKHRSFIVFAMISIVVAGLSSYFRLGRSEDPAFTFRTMIVQAAWPGATLDDTLTQVTERLERKLQETKGLDFLRSYTSPGLTTIFVNLKGSTSARQVPDIRYQVRKNIGDMRRTLPQGVVGPGFNDDFGDTYGLIYAFTADGFARASLGSVGQQHPVGQCNDFKALPRKPGQRVNCWVNWVTPIRCQVEGPDGERGRGHGPRGRSTTVGGAASDTAPGSAAGATRAECIPGSADCGAYKLPSLTAKHRSDDP